jgi:ElaB/YqjD/DUF883 family membrane-anchored ribosome-binding protein
MNPVLRTATADDGASRTSNAIGTPWSELFDGVDDLIHRVAHAENPEIRKSRAKVYATMVIAKNALEQRANQATLQLAQFGDNTDEDLLDYPAQRLGVTLLLGLGLGLIASLGS